MKTAIDHTVAEQYRRFENLFRDAVLMIHDIRPSAQGTYINLCSCGDVEKGFYILVFSGSTRARTKLCTLTTKPFVRHSARTLGKGVSVVARFIDRRYCAVLDEDGRVGISHTNTTPRRPDLIRSLEEWRLGWARKTDTSQPETVCVDIPTFDDGDRRYLITGDTTEPPIDMRTSAIGAARNMFGPGAAALLRILESPSPSLDDAAQCLTSCYGEGWLTVSQYITELKGRR